ncbi:MAG: hypothetical protein U9R11_02500, partial [Chloroflexota bacterium]|nr:hypothetical protein [Chloroflexota bacterium]
PGDCSSLPPLLLYQLLTIWTKGLDKQEDDVEDALRPIPKGGDREPPLRDCDRQRSLMGV